MACARTSDPSIAIIGAGIIGLSCALEFVRRGAHVTLFEKAWPPRGASWAAAGMIAPAFEAINLPGSHAKLFDLCNASAQLWPDWAARLEQESGQPSGFDPTPSLAVARTEPEAARLKAVQTALQTHILAPEFCTNELAEIEPALSDDLVSGLLLPSDGQADNRLTLQALITCVEQHERLQICLSAPLLEVTHGRVHHDGYDATLIAAGWQSGEVKLNANGRDLTLQELDPVFAALEPIGGQMLSVAPIENGPSRTIRSQHIYIVPKSDRIVIGATSEPGRALSAPEPAQIAKLRAQAIQICPVLADAPVLETWAGVRPGFKNHGPILGQTQLPDLYVATGHYRNGILLAPLTAKWMADMILAGEVAPLCSAFAPMTQVRARV